MYRASAAREVSHLVPIRAASSLTTRPSGVRVPVLIQRQSVDGHARPSPRWAGRSRAAALRPSASPAMISARTLGVESVMMILALGGARTVWQTRWDVADD